MKDSMKKMFALPALLIAGSFLAACSSTVTKTAEIERKAEYERSQVAAAAKNNASFVSTVEFDRGSKTVTAASADRLREMIMNAKATGKIDEVRVAAWADESYPSDQKKKLGAKQRDLAKERGANIKDLLKKDLNVDDVEVYNMAERPNAAEKFFNTSDAKVKRAIESAGLANSPDVLRGSVSKATVMIIMED
jgi:hypothetical protein